MARCGKCPVPQRTSRDKVAARRYSLANSAGILLGPDYAFDLTRPGIALYGGVPVPAATGIRPVAAIEAQVLQVRAVDAQGNPQVEASAPPAPDGSTGLHTISVKVD